MQWKRYESISRKVLKRRVDIPLHYLEEKVKRKEREYSRSSALLLIFTQTYSSKLVRVALSHSVLARPFSGGGLELGSVSLEDESNFGNHRHSRIRVSQHLDD